MLCIASSKCSFYGILYHVYDLSLGSRCTFLEQLHYKCNWTAIELFVWRYVSTKKDYINRPDHPCSRRSNYRRFRLRPLGHVPCLGLGIDRLINDTSKYTLVINNHEPEVQFGAKTINRQIDSSKQPFSDCPSFLWIFYYLRRRFCNSTVISRASVENLFNVLLYVFMDGIVR